MNTNTHKMIRRIARALCLLFALDTASANLRAATITVTNTADSGAGTLRAALASASPGDTINFSLLVPTTILLTSGELLISNSVTILGPGPKNLAIDGNAANLMEINPFAAHRVFYIAPSNTVTISGLTITNGAATLSSKGGGIHNDRATLAVSNCVVTGNWSDYQGGGIYNAGFQTGGDLWVVGSTVIGNSAENHGGGIYNIAGTVRLIESTVSGNSVNNGGGGGIFNASGILRIANTCISSNLGSGIVNQVGVSNAITAITSATLVGNRAGVGGAVINSGGVVGITNCLLAHNFASFAGGAIFNQGAGSNGLQIVNSTLSSNAVPFVAGGGRDGGAIFTGSTETSIAGNYGIVLLNCTINGNSAYRGGGIFVSDDTSPVRLGGTILNRGASGVNISAGFSSDYAAVPHSLISLGYNLSSDDVQGSLTNAADQINTDPMLGPLQDNGGPTFTHAPLPGSPAIDRGKNFNAFTTDQRGLPRTLNLAGIPNATGGDGTDIGAVEMDASLRLVNTGIVSNQFGFNLTGPFTNVVVEASTTFTNWTPVATNTLGDAALRFNDPTPPSQPKHFYRARVQ